MRTRHPHGALCLALLATAWAVSPAAAQVPVNDAARTKEETNTAVCTQRARTFKQSSVAPSRGVTSSVTTKADLAGIQQVNGATVFGSPLSGTTIANSDLSILLAVGQSVQALKTKNVGQVMNALAAVAAAINANTSTLKSQQGAIGTANSLQGAFDQNTAARLSGAQIWNQAIQAVTTTVRLRNQRLVDQAAADSAAAKVMTYDPGSVSFVGGNGGNE
jgi:predicted nucleotidyltransferase